MIMSFRIGTRQVSSFFLSSGFLRGRRLLYQRRFTVLRWAILPIRSDAGRAPELLISEVHRDLRAPMRTLFLYSDCPDVTSK
jgi:hypothetical protein